MFPIHGDDDSSKKTKHMNAHLTGYAKLTLVSILMVLDGPRD